MTITRVQEARNAPGTAGVTSRSVTVAATAAGNLFLVAVMTGNTAVTHNAPTDNATGGSSTYTQVGTAVTNGGQRLTVWRSLSGKAGATSVTATVSADPANFLDVYFAEYNGSGGATWIQDATNQGTGNSTTASSGAFASAAGDLLFAAGLTPSATATSLANLVDTTNGNGIADTLGGTGGSVTATFTTTSGAWCCLGASFTPSSSGTAAAFPREGDQHFAGTIFERRIVIAEVQPGAATASVGTQGKETAYIAFQSDARSVGGGDSFVLPRAPNTFDDWDWSAWFGQPLAKIGSEADWSTFTPPALPPPPNLGWDDFDWNRAFSDIGAWRTASSGEEFFAVLPKSPNAFDDWDWSNWFSTALPRVSDEPDWSTFTPPALPLSINLGWDEFEWNRSFGDAGGWRFAASGEEVFATQPSAPFVPDDISDDTDAIRAWGAQGFAGFVTFDEFVNAPTGVVVFGPAPKGRSVRFGFSISAFR